MVWQHPFSDHLPLARPEAEVRETRDLYALRSEHLEQRFGPCQPKDTPLHLASRRPIPHTLFDEVLDPLEEK